MLKRFIQTILLLVILTSPLVAAVDYLIEDQLHVIEKVCQIEQKGRLMQKANGYLYIEVSDDFIAVALPLIDCRGKIVPLSHYTRKKGIGAHISVILEDERIWNDIWEVKELGQEFTFTVMELRTVKQAKKLWLLAVDAPDLENLRESYGLSPKLKGHDFHITIGSEVPNQRKEISLEPVLQEAA
jgi:hypothetical protein